MRDHRRERGGRHVLGQGQAVAAAVEGADAVDERGGQLVGGAGPQLVVEAQAAVVGGEDRAADLEVGAEELLPVVAGVRVVHDVAPTAPRQPIEHGAGAGVGVHRVEAHVHVPEVVDLVLGDRARVGGPEHRRNVREPGWDGPIQVQESSRWLS